MTKFAGRFGGVGLCILVLTVSAVPARSAVSVPEPFDPFARLAARLAPAVVNISSTQLPKTPNRAAPDAPLTGPDSPFDQFFRDFFDHEQGDGSDDARPKGRKAMSLGSGFVVDPDGLVVTNNHVIEGADEIKVVLQDDTELKAELVGRDADTDLALLRVKPAHPLTAAKFGDSDQAKVGDWVMAVGNPYGLGGTVTAGIISARARQINNDGPYDEFLQTDAAINRGNSGGPLFNLAGDVIGINSAIYSNSGGSIGIGFAIPSRLADHVIGQIKQYGKVRRGYLGARIEGLTDDSAKALGLDKPAGVLVAGVPPNSPAQKSGVEPGDVILSLDGQTVADTRQLQRVTADSPLDRDLPLRVWRDRSAKLINVNVGLAEVKAPEQVASVPKKPDASPPGSQLKELGLTLAPVSPDLKEKFQLNDTAKIVVTGIQATGPAADKGVRPGDVVVEIAQEEIKSLADVTRTIAEARKGGRKSVLMLIDRGGDLRFVALKVDQG